MPPKKNRGNRRNNEGRTTGKWNRKPAQSRNIIIARGPGSPDCMTFEPIPGSNKLLVGSTESDATFVVTIDQVLAGATTAIKHFHGKTKF